MSSAVVLEHVALDDPLETVIDDWTTVCFNCSFTSTEACPKSQEGGRKMLYKFTGFSVISL